MKRIQKLIRTLEVKSPIRQEFNGNKNYYLMSLIPKRSMKIQDYRKYVRKGEKETKQLNQEDLENFVN